MNENEIVRNGKAYIPEDYAGTDCGRELGKCCAFEGLKCWEFAECAPDKRIDKRNVIFVEKQQ